MILGGHRSRIGWRPFRLASVFVLVSALLGALPTGFSEGSASAATTSAAATTAASSPRSSPPIPYEIPLTAHLQGLMLTAGKTIKLIVGPINGSACGYATLPGLTGIVPEANISVTNNPVQVQLLANDGLKLAEGYSQVEGNATATISHTPAANGGLLISLQASFKGTAVIAPLGITVPVGACSLTVGNANVEGLSPADLSNLQAQYKADPTLFNYFTPLAVTNGTSGPAGGPYQTGQPVTGPPTAGVTKVVAADFPVPQFFTDTTPAPGTPTNLSGCGSVVPGLGSRRMPRCSIQCWVSPCPPATLRSPAQRRLRSTRGSERRPLARRSR